MVNPDAWICENISEVIFFIMLLPQYTRPASQDGKRGLNVQHRRDRKVSWYNPEELLVLHLTDVRPDLCLR